MTTTATRRPAPVVPAHGALRPLGLDEVELTDGFWAERQRRNAEVSIPHCDRWETKVGWIDNFRHVLDGQVERRTGREFADSDVYKLLEAMAWEAGRSGDAELDARIEQIALLVEAAQDDDGYVSTRYGRPGQEPRYSDLAWGHELYCFGHLIQAAVARLRTGHDDSDDTLVRVARRAADHVCAEFGPGGRDGVCGHPEIEVALVELARATGERRYLDQARLFLDRRGRGTLPDIEFGRSYYQDDRPVREAQVLRGHVVRALYLAAAAVDVAVDTHDDELLEAVRGQFARTLARRTYLTGGMGSHHQDEAYGDDFELPADRAYSETCAGVGSVMVAWRLLLATGDVSWGDVVERTLYNVVATSPSRDGDAFFYTNPLHKREPGEPADPDRASPRALSRLRAPWFEVSCCPTNVARTLASLAGYVATVSAEGVQIHQHVGCRIATTLENGEAVRLEVLTSYPDDGSVVVRVLEAPAGDLTLSLRVPEWSVGRATLDGRAVDGSTASVRRKFAAGDEICLQLDVRPRLTAADDRVDAVRGCVAVERGPVVLCAESADLPAGTHVDRVRLAAEAVPRDDSGSGGGVRVDGLLVERADRSWPYGPPGDPEPGDRVELRLVPYHDWANRGPSTMRVWLPQAR
ncbi:glycoside hydrolase family 127 protein [Myceligenerans sp. I2]|uniref:Glycoside hydrolase family 127 protein n=2 Tax=Myceligenerans indicum TaxID=2593663 RepID=A0ABS1LFY7_9MICO|nr:glycoside hydrolase family 127 protein [Myceligenerans indicum]